MRDRKFSNSETKTPMAPAPSPRETPSSRRFSGTLANAATIATIMNDITSVMVPAKVDRSKCPVSMAVFMVVRFPCVLPVTVAIVGSIGTVVFKG